MDIVIPPLGKDSIKCHLGVKVKMEFSPHMRLSIKNNIITHHMKLHVHTYHRVVHSISRDD